MAKEYFSFRGDVFAGPRDASGNPLGLTFMGNVPNLQVKMSVETDEHVESTSGMDLVDDLQVTKRSAEISLDAEELLKDVLGFALNATVTEVTAGTVSDEALCATPEIGKIFLLGKQNVSSVVLSDSVGTVDAGKYTVNGPHGSIEFSSVTGVTGPVTADYSYGAARKVVMFQQVLPEIWIRLNGINKTKMSKVVVDLYRVRLNPAETLDFINSGARSKFTLSGAVLADQTKTAEGDFGQFGRMVLPTV